MEDDVFFFQFLFRRYLFRGRTSCWTSGEYPTCTKVTPNPQPRWPPDIAPPKQWETICLKISRNSASWPDIHNKNARGFLDWLFLFKIWKISPQLKVGPNKTWCCFCLAVFFGSYEEEIGISHDFLTTLFPFFGEEPSQQNGSNPVANVDQKPRWDVNPYIASTGGVFFFSLAVGWTTRSRFLSWRIRKNPQNIRGVFFSERDVRYIFENTLRFGDDHHDLKLGISWNQNHVGLFFSRTPPASGKMSYTSLENKIVLTW